MPAPDLTPEQLDRVHELFVRALDLDEAERRDFCARECADDPDLREELESLLGLEGDVDDSFLAAPLLSAAAARELGTPQPALPESVPPLPDPEQIGPYRITGRIGEGGMGVVYRAEQTEPVRRTVALKIVKPGMDTARVLARFQVERQALALMEHPSIARIHDSGATDTGRPWFAMDLVDGSPITHWADTHRLGTKARLELFCQLCDAVQHAHQKGVIHRDLKPSNVLVTERDSAPCPVIIDFGIARAVDEPLTDHTQLTYHHELVGTLDYMAPEQAGTPAGSRPRDIDSRADIYSLGVLLYELLTGERPFDAGTPLPNRTAQPPSTRVRRTSTTTQAAACQAADARTLRRRLRGALDCIALKALEHDRDRRYASASELAADVRRFLADEPVTAGSPGAWYRLRTFVRRNRVPVTAAALVFLALLAGGGVAAWGLYEARDQRDEARRLAASLEREVRSSERASDLVIDWLAMINLENGPFDKRRLIDRAAREVESAFGHRPRAEAAVRKVIGQAYASMAEPALAHEQLSNALRLLEGLADVQPIEQYEILWELAQGTMQRGSWHAFQGILNRLDSMAVHVFIEDHPDLARFLDDLRRASDPLETDRRLNRALQYAELRLPARDPRWLLLGDFFTVRTTSAAFTAQQRADDDGREELARVYRESEWNDKLLRIYRDRAGLMETNIRMSRARVRDIGALFSSHRHDEVVARATELETQLDNILPKTHFLQTGVRHLHGRSLAQLGELEQGLALLEESTTIVQRESPESWGGWLYLKSWIDACDAAGHRERAASLRREMVAEMLRTPEAGLRFPAMETSLGGDYSDLVGSIRTCWERGEAGLGDLPDLLARCNARLPREDIRAAILAGGLLRITHRAAPSPKLLPVLEHCCEVLRAHGADAALLPAAAWRLAFVRLEIGDIENALLHARRGLGLCTGPEAPVWSADFERLIGRCLYRMGNDEAEEHLACGYEELARTAGLVHSKTIEAHRWLQEFYLHHERHREATERAHERLEHLLRQAASPDCLGRTAWFVVRSPAGAGGASQTAVRAMRKASRLRPDSAEYRALLGAALLRCGSLEAAHTELREAERIGGALPRIGSASLPALQAITLARLGRRAEAGRALRRAKEDGAAKADRRDLTLILAEAVEAVQEG